MGDIEQDVVLSAPKTHNNGPGVMVMGRKPDTNTVRDQIERRSTLGIHTDIVQVLLAWGSSRILRCIPIEAGR
jgi:hypothetical protein